MLGLEQHGMHQGDPVVGGGQSLQQGLWKDLGGGTCPGGGRCLLWSIFTEVANCEAAHFLLQGWFLRKQQGYLPSLSGKYCNLRNPEGAAPKRGKCQPLLGMGNGAMSAEDPLARLLVFGLSSMPVLQP